MYDRVDLNYLQSQISQKFSHFTDSMQINSAIDEYNSSLTLLRDELAPLKTVCVSDRISSEWFNTVCRDAKRNKRRAERKWRKSKTHASLLAYQKKCIEYHRVLVEERTASIQAQVDICGQKRLFKIARKLLGNCAADLFPTAESHLQLANDFDAFFIQKVKRLRNKITPSESSPSFGLPTSSPALQLSKFESFNLLNNEDVIDIVKSMETKTCDLDPFPTNILVSLPTTMISLFRKLINSSLSSGLFPEALKLGLVSPILKKHQIDHTEFSNFRPITSIPFISKIFEKVVVSKLVKHLDDNGLNDQFQSAYRKFFSTETAILKVHDDIMQALDTGECILSVYLDMSAAFDTIDHNILLNRLIDIGISGSALGWFQSYLISRRQCVKIKSSISDPVFLECGVPQGFNSGSCPLHHLHLSPQQYH
ncbi:uncharacterized protein LOC117120638 [Anneissia japonica]|uniref:uncharacterized protein LOC117120638 n=1 Tax=Anneissia japonica TaxID=1529436 RepID=UPI001425A354|nr:uncharacterized protein LOC117120638 [Anneissia japonica]